MCSESYTYCFVMMLNSFYIQTAILGMMYVTAVAYGLVWSGIVIDNDVDELGGHHKTIFAGGFLICLFWVCEYISLL